MAKSIPVRDVPDQVRDELAARAARSGPHARTVVDASEMVSALVDSGPAGEWVLGALSVGGLLAPHPMPVEVANLLRRAVSAGRVAEEGAAQAHADLLDLQVTLLPYAPFADRARELRQRMDAYDGWYVAAASALDAPLVTLDRRLASREDVRCTVLKRMRLENTLDFVFIAGYWLLYSGLGLLLALHQRLVASQRGRGVLAVAGVACATGDADLPARVDAVRGASLVKWSFVFAASALAGLAFLRRGRVAATLTGAAFLAGAALGTVGLASDGNRFLVEWAMHVLVGAVGLALWGLSAVTDRGSG